MDPIKIEEEAEMKTLHCPECGGEMVIDTTGSWHFDGEPWDDIRELLVCINCDYRTDE